MEASLSTGLYDYEILEALDNKVKILTYAELQKYKDIRDVLSPFNKVVILYSTSDSYGHWVCLFKYKGVIHFFDSYGYFPDDEREFIPPAYLRMKYDEIPHLTFLLAIAKEPIEYNEFKLQSENTHTCGRWCVVRLLLKDYSDKKFAKLFKDLGGPLSDEKTYDQLVVHATRGIN